MSTHTAIWLDGAPAAALPLPDRGLDFGDGLFETLLLQRGQPLYTDLHWGRMLRGLQVLGFPDCLGAAREQLAAAARAVQSRGWHWAVIRLSVTRGAGPRGYAPPLAATARIIISVTELERDCLLMQAPAALSVAQVRWPTQPLLAGIKHLNRLEQVLASAEYRAAGADETVMLNQSGHVISVAAGNLFTVQGGQISTPALLDCGIAGTRRRRLMETWAPAIGCTVKESTITLQDLRAADEVFYSNSLQGLRPVASLGETRWSSHPVCDALFQQYRGEQV